MRLRARNLKGSMLRSLKNICCVHGAFQAVDGNMTDTGRIVFAVVFYDADATIPLYPSTSE